MFRAVGLLFVAYIALLHVGTPVHHTGEEMSRTSAPEWTSMTGYPRPCYCEQLNCSGRRLMRTQWYLHNGTTTCALARSVSDTNPLAEPASVVNELPHDANDEYDPPMVARRYQPPHERVELCEHKADPIVDDAVPMDDDERAWHPTDSIADFHEQLYPSHFQPTTTSSGAASYLLLLVQVALTQIKQLVCVQPCVYDSITERSSTALCRP
jgi:hypothetical protein